MEVIHSRRSIRSFLEQPLPRDVVETIAGVASWASCSCNRQTTKIFITSSRKLIPDCLSANSGATCLSEYVPLFMCFCADLRAYDMPAEMTLPVLDVSLGVQNSCLLAQSLGVGMTLLNWTHHSEDQDRLLRKTLGIPSYYRIVVNAVLGYPAHGAPVPVRKSSNLTYSFVGE